MKIILVIVFGIMFCLKLALVGIMANASWWIVFSPLLLIASWYVFFWLLFVLAMSKIFPSLTMFIARSLK